MHKIRRWLRSLLIIMALVIVVTAGGLARIFYRALPDYTGDVKMQGLSAPVSVYRDEHDVPHIFAATMNDAARTLGYIHASDRMFQMELNRRAGQGRLAEIFGSDMLSIDKFTRTMGFYHLADASYGALSPDTQKLFDAYAEGVNRWLRSHRHKLPPEFTLLHITPEPWKPADSLVWAKLMAFQLSENYKFEILRAQLAKTLSARKLEELFPPSPGNTPITLEPKLMQTGDLGGSQNIHAVLSNWLPAVTKILQLKQSKISAPDQLGRITGLDYAASNEWVVAGAHTESGKPILANDPHLGLEAPILWYLARIVTPHYSIKGATVPGLPLVLLGQNDHIAWGLTTTGSDVEDLFIETIDPKNADQYMTPLGAKPFDTRTETIHVKDEPDVELKVRLTRHGPVLSDIDGELAALVGDGKVMALAFTGLGDRDTTAEALLRVNHATNWNEFQEALHLYQSPPQNIVYADQNGNIGFVAPGLVPVRKAGNGLMPVDGASGQYDWRGMMPAAQVPALYNPPAGFIFNANNPVAPVSFNYFLGSDWEESYRAQRLQQFFNTIGKHSLDTSAAMQADHLSLPAHQFMPYLRRLKPSDPRQAEAIEMLNKWNGVMDKDKPEPLIFDAWLYELHQILLVDETSNPLKEKGPFAAETIASLLANNISDWCGGDATTSKPVTNCDAIILEALDKALTLLTTRDGPDIEKWRWGNEHKAILTNKVFSHVPVLSTVTDLSLPSSGDFYTLDRGGSNANDPEHPFARTHGGGFRGIYDLADPAQSRFMIATGQSGQIFSPHYGDLSILWNDVKSFTISGSPEELAARGLPVLKFIPASLGAAY